MPEFTGFDEEPIATRKSDVFGETRLYAPDADPSVWADLPFMIETQHGDWKVTRTTIQRINPETNLLEDLEVARGEAVEDKSGPGIKLLVRSDRAHDAFNRLGLLSMQDLWEDSNAEVMRL